MPYAGAIVDGGITQQSENQHTKEKKTLFGDENYELSLIQRISGNLVRSKNSGNFSKW